MTLTCSSHQTKEKFRTEANPQVSPEKAEWSLPGQTRRLCHPGGLLQHRLVFGLGKPLASMSFLSHPLTHPDKLETSLRGAQPEKSPASSAKGDYGFTQGRERKEEGSCSLPSPCFFAVSGPDLSLLQQWGSRVHTPSCPVHCFIASFFVLS